MSSSMRAVALGLALVAGAGGAAAARPAALFHGHVTATLPAGWRAERHHFVSPDGKSDVEVLIRSEPASRLAIGFRDDGIDGFGAASAAKDGKVGGLPGVVVTVGDDTDGGVFGATETCLGTITIRALWDSHDAPAVRAQLRAIVKSARIHLAGADPFANDDEEDEPILVPDPDSRPVADHVVGSICGTIADDATALLAASVRVQTGDGSVTVLAPELAAQVRAAHGLGAFAHATVGPWGIVRREDDTVVVYGGAHDSGDVVLGHVDGAWRIVAIERKDP